MGSESTRPTNPGAPAPGGSPPGRGPDAAPPIKRGPAYPRAVDALVEEFAKLPGIGRRSAERLAFHVLKSDEPTAMGLSRAIQDVKRSVRHCAACGNFADSPRCAICADPGRDHGQILVVEQPKDLIALEQTGMYRGVYHVLMGRLSPLEGIGPGDLNVGPLLARVDGTAETAGVKVREVILGLNPNVEGDGTALYLSRELARRGVGVSRLARGLPSGSQLEYANKAVLADAIEGRQRMD